MSIRLPDISSDSDDEDDKTQGSDDSPNAGKNRFGKPVNEPNLASDIKGKK